MKLNSTFLQIVLNHSQISALRRFDLWAKAEKTLNQLVIIM